MIRVAYLGGKKVGKACLEVLVEKQSELGFEAICVAPTPRGDEVEHLANKHGIPLVKHTEELPECDILISVQYHLILKQHIIDRAKRIAVNLHMAPLPEYRGCNQFSLAIINDDKEFGVTLHRLEAGVDSGDIISEHRFPIPENCWVEDLVRLATTHTIKLFEQSLPAIIDGTYSLIPQESYISSRGTSLNFRKDIEPLKLLDLNWSGKKLDRFIRALSMPGFEPPYVILNDGQKILLTKG